MSKKQQSLFDVVYKAFGGWSPGGCVEDTRFVIPLTARKLPCFEQAMQELNSINLHDCLIWGITGFKVAE